MDSKINSDNIMDLVVSNDNLLIEILARLPCRDAVLFKLVCKRWSSLISSNYFISFFIHLRHRPIHDSISFSPTYKLAFQFEHAQTRLYDYSLLLHCERSTTTTHPVVHSLDLSFLPRPREEIALRATCDDLILCSFYDDVTNNNLYLCNLQTKQYVALPPPAVNHHREDIAVGLLCDPAPCSFCHDQGGCGGVDNSRYKFMVMQIHEPCPVTTQFQVQLFSSEEGEWRNYVVSSPEWTLCYEQIKSLVPYKGKLHWVIYPYVLVFDPYNAPGQVCRVIHLPFGPHFAPHIFCAGILNFGVFNDRLRVAYTLLPVHPVRYYYIQELEDYDIGKWRLVQKLHSVEDLDVGSCLLHGDGNVICYDGGSSATWLCNLQSGAMDDNKYKLVPPRPDMFYSINHFQIADQCWPTPIPSLQRKP